MDPGGLFPDVSGYVECENCGFVLLSQGDAQPSPKRWEACPDCGETAFCFVDE